MEKQILRYIKEQNMIQKGDTVAVALSGGADSVCLLHILRILSEELQIRLCAIHVHHGIRETADRDEKFVQDLCQTYQIDLTVVHVDVPQTAKEAGSGIEETARKLRYEAFAGVEANKLALAHHCQDQTETLLLNLVRGSGLRGLAGMLPVHGRVIRPLLTETPEVIREYLRKHGWRWMEDETNQDVQYRRNRMRHQILPILEAHYNPKVTETIAAAAGLLQEDEAALMAWTLAVYSRCCTSKGLAVKEILELPAAIRKRCIRKYLEDRIGLTDISQQHMLELEKLLQLQSGKRIVIPGGYEVVREYERIYVQQISEKNTKKPLEWSVTEIPGHVRIELFDRILDFSFVENMENYTFSEKVYTKCFDYDKIKGTLAVRTRRPGDYLTVAGGHKKLKEYLIDEKIPASKRDQVLLLADGSHILWVIGYRMSDVCKIGEDTTRVLQVSCSTYEGTEIRS